MLCRTMVLKQAAMFIVWSVGTFGVQAQTQNNHQFVEGTQVIEADQVVGRPELINPHGRRESFVGLRYYIDLLSTVKPIPLPGRILVSPPPSPVIGRVLAVEKFGEKIRVTLESVAIKDVFSELLVNETMEFKDR